MFWNVKTPIIPAKIEYDRILKKTLINSDFGLIIITEIETDVVIKTINDSIKCRKNRLIGWFRFISIYRYINGGIASKTEINNGKRYWATIANLKSFKIRINWVKPRNAIYIESTLFSFGLIFLISNNWIEKIIENITGIIPINPEIETEYSENINY